MKADDARVWLCATDVDGDATEDKLTIDKRLTAHQKGIHCCMTGSNRNSDLLHCQNCLAYVYIMLSNSDEKIRI